MTTMSRAVRDNNNSANVFHGNENSNDKDVLRLINAIMGLMRAVQHRLIAICPMPIKVGLNKLVGNFLRPAVGIPSQSTLQADSGDQVVPHFLEFEMDSITTNFELRLRKENAKPIYCAECLVIVSSIQKSLNHMKTRVIELEQKNDDLERALRQRTISMEDYKAKFDSAIEQIALLETELEEEKN